MSDYSKWMHVQSYLTCSPWWQTLYFWHLVWALLTQPLILQLTWGSIPTSLLLLICHFRVLMILLPLQIKRWRTKQHLVMTAWKSSSLEMGCLKEFNERPIGKLPCCHYECAHYGHTRPPQCWLEFPSWTCRHLHKWTFLEVKVNASNVQMCHANKKNNMISLCRLFYLPLSTLKDLNYNFIVAPRVTLLGWIEATTYRSPGKALLWVSWDMTSFECFLPSQIQWISIETHSKDFHKGAPGKRALVWLTNQPGSSCRPAPPPSSRYKRRAQGSAYRQTTRTSCTAQPERQEWSGKIPRKRDFVHKLVSLFTR